MSNELIIYWLHTTWKTNMKLTILLAAQLASCLRVKIVPYPIAGDVTRFTEEAPLVGLDMAPHAAADKTILADAVSAALKAMLQEEAQQRAAAAVAAAAALGWQASNTTLPFHPSLDQLFEGVHADETLRGSAVMASYVGSSFASHLTMVETVFGFIFIVGLLDYNSPELVGLLTRIYMAYFVFEFLIATWFSLVFLKPERAAWVPSGLIIPLSGGVASAVVFIVTGNLKRKSRHFIPELGFFIFGAAMCSMLPLWRSELPGLLGPALICGTAVVAGKQFATSQITRWTRGILAASVTTVGALGTLNRVWIGTQIFYPCYLLSPFYARFVAPVAWGAAALVGVTALVLILSSAALQALRETQRKFSFDDSVDYLPE
eukprot:Gregarina_sp_Poly_1__6136@NODE_323_length_9530_cov_14_322836_g275_i0_p3_GENE_NODE_323_length_9530_cov_14_322836_g275_i0NODE_323_length_9530_cov_14_322836_g275_i0_p3_ORF_typecomplete_len376_score47_67PSK_trans_fac/PF07704_11/0_031PSK_trans_fac/PF07704_11/1_8e04PDR_assoc/PF08370_11/2_4e02PDR_assoc/PF08370_11/0_64_NODE_323_length_9530_cov_14_322836_g275_i025583685